MWASRPLRRPLAKAGVLPSTLFWVGGCYGIWRIFFGSFFCFARTGGWGKQNYNSSFPLSFSPFLAACEPREAVVCVRRSSAVFGGTEAELAVAFKIKAKSRPSSGGTSSQFGKTWRQFIFPLYPFFLAATGSFGISLELGVFDKVGSSNLV